MRAMQVRKRRKKVWGCFRRLVGCYKVALRGRLGVQAHKRSKWETNLNISAKRTGSVIEILTSLATSYLQLPIALGRSRMHRPSYRMAWSYNTQLAC